MLLLGGTSDLRSNGPNFVPLWATRYHYWGLHLSSVQPDPIPYHSWLLDSINRVVHLSSGQPPPTEYQFWPLDSSTGGLIIPQVSLIQRLTKCQADLKEYHSWSLDATTGGTSQLRSTTLNWVPILATRCLYWGYIYPQVSLAQRLTKCQA